MDMMKRFVMMFVLAMTMMVFALTSVVADDTNQTMNGTVVDDVYSGNETFPLNETTSSDGADSENETTQDDDVSEVSETLSGNMTQTRQRFALGFQKLPKMVEDDEVDEGELESIIRSNSLNPGVLNRLIKTGKLGNGSINAVLETQKRPMGIFKKFLSYIGFAPATPASLIYETYNVSEETEQKLLTRDDLPKRYANKLKNKLKEEVKNEAKTSENKTKGKDKLSVASQGKSGDVPKGNADKSQLKATGNPGAGLQKKDGTGKSDNGNSKGAGNSKAKK